MRSVTVTQHALAICTLDSSGEAWDLNMLLFPYSGL